MQIVFVLAIFGLALFGDAIFTSWIACAAFAVLLVIGYLLYRYFKKKREKWEQDKDFNDDFDEKDFY